MAFAAGLALPQPLHAGDTTISNTIVSTPQTVSASIGQYSITATGTLTSTAEATLFNLETIGTLTNQGRVLNTDGSLSAIQNANSIGSIVNSGTISGGGRGLLNRRENTASTIVPVIGAITNSGVIVGSAIAGIENFGGTIGTLTNSGTITGPTAILSTDDDGRAGIIRTIINSRLIAGDIVNTGGGALTINGGSGSTIGTLTGFTPGSRGTITSSANILFGSGNLLLNDDIAAPLQTVVNQGGVLTLTAPGAIDADFSQTAGRLVFGTLGSLSITGKATITGGTVAASLSSTGTYIVGSVISTLVTAGDTSDYGGATIATTLATGLAARGTTSGNDLLLIASNDYVGGTLATLTNTGTITGAVNAVVIAATGSVGTLANTGLLSGNSRGILVNVGGRIGTVTNQGRIIAVGGAGAAGGIANSGNIDSIVNTGTIISGASSGIGNNLNGASIGQITNSGLITAATGGIYSQGTIATLSNSGEIVGAQGVSLTGGSIGLIDNSGTLRGVTALYIGSGASVGSIVNSGIIAGKITNLGTSGLTITGGSGSAIGTLTGSTLTNQGSISHTLSDLVLNGGNLLLNDHVNVTGHTLINNGATVYVTAIDTITGAFSQTSGTLDLAPTRGGLNVTGAATIAGTVRSTFSSTGNYLQGSYALLRGSSLGLGAATVTTNTITGLYHALSTIGSTLSLSIANDYVGGALATLTNGAAITGASTGLYVATTGSIGTLTNTGTFGGNQFGVNNRGTIGTFANAGQITNNNFTAFWNQGSIGQLTNSGTISNNSWAILNSGTIATLTNTGVIAGAGNAVQNNGRIDLLTNTGTMSGQTNVLAGDFGTIANAGIIRGNVNGNGGTIGTIIGGTGGAVGTFTGFNGTVQGTIGASANLVFASGALLLNDRIAAIGTSPANLTISNIGADIALSTIVTIGANFRQTAGMLSLGSSGRLVVTEVATFSGGTIAASIGGGNASATYRVGDAIGGALITAGVGSSYTGVSIAASGGITGLSAAGMISGTDLILAADNIYVGDTQSSIGNSGTISGHSYALFVANTGAVGTLDNSGILSGTVDGLSNNGTVGLLGNSGHISGSQKGLGNQGTIGTLLNAAGGTILGGTAAGLQNDTALGTLINAGVISSNSAGFANYGVLGSLGNSGTITGGPQAIYNAGTITGALVNSGSITSGQSALGLGGVVGTLVNSGFIGGGSQGLNLGGTLGTLVNQAGGTISAGNALYLDGTLGGLSNSGLIRGNIQNASANTLTISGGAAGTIGTLTGQSGRGTITSTLGNLVFASGELLLNDNIVATGRTVSNVGASLALNTLINLTGTYAQSGGTLTIDPTLGGLLVSGAATISGGTVRSSLSSTGNYLQNSYTLIGASSLALSGAPVSINTITGLSRTTSTVGNALLLSIANDYVGGTLATLSNSAAITTAATGLYVATTGSIGTVTNSGTFGGQQFGVNNRGTIATLSNAGLITNVNFTALWNQGSIGRLLNSGTITNSSWAILNSGTIGTLTNSGLISGAGVAVQNNAQITLLDNRGTLSGNSAFSGNVATIANSGLIRGDINRSSGTVGTIVGGSGGAIGTFTGASGTVRGTIGAGADLVFASGALLLDNHIVAVGGLPAALTISNVGADIALGTIITINANYQQTGGVLRLANSGALVVTQAAVLSGGTIAASLGGLSATSTYRVGGPAARTLVAGGAGSSYAGVDVALSGGLAGLKVNAVSSGNAYVLAVGNDYIGDTQGSIANSGSIGGATYALYVADSGSIGTLVNSGTLSGTSTGLVNRGSIGTLRNSGRIDGAVGLRNHGIVTDFANSGTIIASGGSGSAGAIVNSGAIGVLSNTGYLSGPVALVNDGTLGTIANSGTIAGDIVNNVAQDLVFTGGTGGGIGVLRGHGNDGQGMITNTLGNVVLAAGDMLLDDSVVLGMGTLINAGAMVRLTNSVSVTGNYAQATGTLALGLSSLLVSGIASISGGLITTDQLDSTGNYLVGAAGGTLVRAGTGSAYQGVSVTSGITGLAVATNVSTIGGNVDLLLTITNDYVGTTLANLVNSGTISGVSTAAHIASTGNLGTLANSGVLDGTLFGVRNLGSIGQLANTGTITGPLALYNGGGIGTIDNAGAIIGSAGADSAGLDNVGQLETLLNRGLLSGETYGVRNSGTIGQFTNEGRIEAPVALRITAAGAVGPIVNSGVIAGRIENLSQQALTIAGGAFDTAGTLTGFNGAHGTLASPLADIVFAPGIQLLDADIVATGHVVWNTGALLGLASGTTITGDYRQSSGGVFLLTGSALVVDGAAELTGGIVATRLASNATYLAGSIAQTLVRGGVGSSYAGVEVDTGDTPGLALRGDANGTDLVVTALNHYVGDSLASLTNSGSIAADYGLFVASTGSLGGLTNTGTLGGSIAAIYNDGTLGPIVNTGVIAGNIDNRSEQTLDIRGGTLTGFAPGTQGTITSTGGDVVLGGTIVLNDAIVVGSHSVINDGGALSLGNIVSITGNFSQASGIVTLDSGAMLAVSGSAAFTGGTIATASAGDGNYLVGGSAGTLVRGGTGSTYTGVTVSTGTRPGLDQAAQVSGNDLVLAALNNYIGGTLGSLSNTGSLSSDYAVFIASTGSLGSLSNSGTLGGSIAAIYNAGTLGPITNTGVIAGNIDNRAAQALSITGGTLTGFARGSQGTISNTLGNVVLGGTMTLDDAIDVGTNTVVNAGGTLALMRNILVIGQFQQQDGLLALGDGATLAVSGRASITGGTISAVVPIAANYRAGSAVGTLVQGGADSTYTGVSVTTGTTPGLALSAGADGTNLVVGALNHYVGATLGTLSNSGSVSQAYPVYVASTGSLGSLINSGTLSGSIAAIYTAGTLGAIANSGLIAGNVENASAQALTIAGGSDMIFGTLTGVGGARGTILSTGANVVFSGGNLLLDDDIVATGRVVSNTGAVLRLANSASIGGGYTQSAGELMLAGGTRLAVGGVASLTGGTVSTSLAANATYLAGSVAGTLVQGGAGSSYTGVSIATGAVPGLAVSAGADGTNLIVTALNNYVGGSLGSLSNTAALTADYPVYIPATGTLGSLTNSGTLGGTIAAIRNLGLIGPIANTGVIAGNIASDAIADLSITGGSGDAFGTLTGFAAGSQGTITNTGGDLVLGGNLLLNDAVNVGGRTMRVGTGTLAVNAPVAITGNYSQTGGKLLIGVTSTTAYGQLQVSGSASLIGTNVTLVRLGTGTIGAGQAYTVVKANGALTFSNLTSSVTGLDGTFSSVASGGANGLVLTLSEPSGTITPPPTSFTGTGLQAGGAGVGTGAALDAIADRGGPDAASVITDVLLPLSQLPLPQQVRAITQLAPTQLTPQVVAVAVSPAVNAIIQHQEVLAATATGREERGLAAGSQGQRGAVWGQVLVSAAQRDKVSAASPYRASSYGVMVGADFIAASNLSAGVAVSWVNSSADGRGAVSGSTTDLDSFQATGYFTWQPGDIETAGFAIDGQLGFGYNHYRQRRRIDFLGATARSAFDGQQYLASLRTTYTIPLSTTTSVTPYASLREVHLRNDRYRETGAGAANLSVAKLEVDALSHDIGIQGAGIFESASGRFAPTLKLGWMHTYNNGPIPLTAVLGGVAFTSTAARGAADGVAVGAGFAFQRSDRFRISVQYDGDLRRDFRSHTGTLKMAVNF